MAHIQLNQSFQRHKVVAKNMNHDNVKMCRYVNRFYSCSKIFSNLIFSNQDKLKVWKSIKYKYIKYEKMNSCSWHGFKIMQYKNYTKTSRCHSNKWLFKRPIFNIFGKAVKQVNHIQTSYEISQISEPIFTKQSSIILSNNSNNKIEKILLRWF